MHQDMQGGGQIGSSLAVQQVYPSEKGEKKYKHFFLLTFTKQMLSCGVCKHKVLHCTLMLLDLNLIVCCTTHTGRSAIQLTLERFELGELINQGTQMTGNLIYHNITSRSLLVRERCVRLAAASHLYYCLFCMRLCGLFHFLVLQRFQFWTLLCFFSRCLMPVFLSACCELSPRSVHHFQLGWRGS